MPVRRNNRLGGPFARRGLGQIDSTTFDTTTPTDLSGGTSTTTDQTTPQYPSSTADLTITPEEAAAGATTDTTTPTDTTTTTTPTATQQQQTTATGLTPGQMAQIAGTGIQATGTITAAAIQASNASPKGSSLVNAGQVASATSTPATTPQRQTATGGAVSRLVPGVTVNTLKMAGGGLVVAGLAVGGYQAFAKRRPKPRDFVLAGGIAAVGLGIMYFAK